MVSDPEHFERLVCELAELSPEERSRLIAEAARRAKTLPRFSRFLLPRLSGGAAWTGGELQREDLYGEEGR